MTQHLKKRGSTYYVRVAVPRSLQAVVGKPEFVRTTGQSDRRLAERAKHRIIAEIYDEIEAKVDTNPASPTWLDRQVRGLREAVQRGDIDEQLASDIVHDLREKHLSADGKSSEDELPTDQLAHLRRVTRLATDMEYAPLSDLIEDYLTENEEVLRPSTINMKRRVLGELKDWLGGDPDLLEVDRKVAGRYVSEVLTKNSRNWSTNVDAISNLSAFFKWSLRRGGHSAENPWTGLGDTIPKPKRGTKKGKRRPWTKPELKRLFAKLPDGTKYYYKEMCAIALYSGMRQNEIAELEVSDIDLRRRIIDLPEGKTESSVREIPIHSILLPVIKRLCKETDSTYLFPTFVPAGADKKRAFNFQKRFSDRRNELFPETVHEINDRGHRRSEINFHTLRNTFIRELEIAGVPVWTTEQIVGHKRRSMSYGTYSPGVDLKSLREAVAKVSYGAVNKLVSLR